MSNVSVNTHNGRYTGKEGWSKPADYYEEKLRRHQEAELLDHPDGSVTDKKIADNAVSVNHLRETFKLPSEKLENRAVKNKHIGIGEILSGHLATGAVDCDALADKVVSVNHLSEEIVEEHHNLLTSDIIHTSTWPCSFSLELVPGKTYCCNIPTTQLFGGVQYVNDGSLETHPYTVIDGGFSIVMTDLSPTNTLVVMFNNDVDASQLILVEGDTLPEYTIPFGESNSISNELLQPVYGEIRKSKLVPDDTSVIEIQGASVLPIRVGKSYEITLTENTSFWLPTVAERCDQIVVHAIIENEISIDWGTTYFYNGEIPYITTGEYEFIFSWIRGRWVVGVLEIGEGATS